MTVMAGVRLIFDMRRVNGDATSLLFGRLVDLVVVSEQGTSFLG